LSAACPCGQHTAIVIAGQENSSGVVRDVIMGMPAGRVVTVTVYNVTAKRWERGWELHIDGVGRSPSPAALPALSA